MNIINKLKKIYRLMKTPSFDLIVEEGMQKETWDQLCEIRYRSFGQELQQAYEGLGDRTNKFWGTVRNAKIPKKVHPLSSEIIDFLTNVVKKNINDIEINEDSFKEIVAELNKDNKLKNLAAKATKASLLYGDSFFYVDINSNGDNKTADFGIFEGKYADFEYDFNGNLIRAVGYRLYRKDNITYKLKIIFEYGRITKELYEEDQKCELTKLEQTQGLSECVEFDNSLLLAIPYSALGASAVFDGRGKSLFEGKMDAFDFLDMVYSEWDYAVRVSQPVTYLPPEMIPVDNNGNFLEPNSFTGLYLKTEGPTDSSGAKEVTFTQATIQIDALERTLHNQIDDVCSGIISPNSLSISNKKVVDPNTSYSKELEKCTQSTIATIQENLIDSLQKLISLLICVKSGRLIDLQDKVEINMSQYAAPSFENKLAIAGEGYKNGLMSLEESIEFIYGDDRTEEWKQKEIERIQGTTQEEISDETPENLPEQEELPEENAVSE